MRHTYLQHQDWILKAEFCFTHELSSYSPDSWTGILKKKKKKKKHRPCSCSFGHCLALFGLKSFLALLWRNDLPSHCGQDFFSSAPQKKTQKKTTSRLSGLSLALHLHLHSILIKDDPPALCFVSSRIESCLKTVKWSMGYKIHSPYRLVVLFFFQLRLTRLCFHSV